MGGGLFLIKDRSWLQKRGCGVHMTIRDIDCLDFDADRMARDFHAMGVTFFSFFAGGYVTTYPSRLRDARISPYLGGRDVTGEIVEAAHKCGIKAIAMADLSILPPETAQRHPGWAAVDAEGVPYLGPSGMYTACIMGGYAQEFGKSMVNEILEHYDVDAVKFGGGSYGFFNRICYCENCRKSYENMFHEPLPLKKDWDDPHWLRYQQWRMSMTSERVKFLHNMVTDVKPGLPVMGNGFGFALVESVLNSALDMEDMAAYQDMIQVEAQDRYFMHPDMSGAWQSLTWTGEEARYMTSVTEKPIWIVVSYFKAWPWRRCAMDYAEQKAYMAQIIANGASPMINLSGGPPAVHEDQRGFRAPAEIFGFLRKHSAYYDGDSSGANVAIVYSQNTLIYYGKDQAREKYVEALRGIERALDERHIPYDIISEKTLDQKHLSRYRTLILPNMACMSAETADIIKEYIGAGGSLVATFETSLFDEKGNKRKELLLSDVLMAEYSGVTEHVNGRQPDGRQNYCRLCGKHPLLEGIEDTEVLPAAGLYCAVKAADNTDVPLTLTYPFIVFPEGLAYATEPDTGHPMAVAYEHAGGGRTIYLPGQFDRLHWITGFPDLSKLFANAILWTLKGDVPAVCDAPKTLCMSLRVQEKRAMVHLVNLTGGSRVFDQIIPVYDIPVRINRNLLGGRPKAFTLSNGNPLDIEEQNGCYSVVLPRIIDYEVVVFEELK